MRQDTEPWLKRLTGRQVTYRINISLQPPETRRTPPEIMSRIEKSCGMTPERTLDR
jgi:hypothetical protein